MRRKIIGLSALLMFMTGITVNAEEYWTEDHTGYWTETGDWVGSGWWDEEGHHNDDGTFAENRYGYVVSAEEADCWSHGNWTEYGCEVNPNIPAPKESVNKKEPVYKIGYIEARRFCSDGTSGSCMVTFMPEKKPNAQNEKTG